MYQFPMYPYPQMPQEPTGGGQQSMEELCKRYLLHLVQMEGTDGNMYEGIIEDVDDEGIDMLIPDGEMDRDDENGMYRQFYGTYGYGPFGYGFGYPRRFRRFRRRRFPIYFFRRLFFPYFY